MLENLSQHPAASVDGCRRIVVLQDRLRPGGTERQSLWLAEVLQAHDSSARLVFFQPPAGGVFSQTLQKRRTPFPWYAPGLVKTLRSLRTDLVFCMGRNANAYGSWLRFCLPDARVISTCRTSRRLPLFYRQAIRHSNRCVTNSQWAADRLVDRGLKRAAEITVIPNALLRPDLLDLDRSFSAVAAARAALELPENRPILCNIASFVPGKNKQGLLRAFAQSRYAGDAILILAGAGAELPACRKLAKKLRVAERVRFLGHVEEISLLLQCSDVFVSTALRDGLPNALVEAQAAGLPVVAFDTGGCGEAFIHGKSGFAVPSGDEAGFAEALDLLLVGEQRCAAFSMAARHHARETFHPERIAARYRQLVREELRLVSQK